jgi:ribose 5-phosphate isomerase B
MKVFFAADHAGYALKEVLLPFVQGVGCEAIDRGASAHEPEDDYPDVVTPCAWDVAAAPGSLGIILGGSGQGEAIAANRVPGVRAAVYYGGTIDIVRLARQHNDANVLSLGARFVSEDEAKEAVRTFLETPFPGEERHRRRIGKLEEGIAGL